MGKCGPSLSESTTKIWHANKLSEVVTERTENPPVQTTPRLPLRNLIGQWNSLHSNKWNLKKMRNFQTFKLNHDFRASYLQHRQTEFSISIMITMPIFSSSVCVFLKVFLILDAPEKSCIQWFPLVLDEGNHQLKPRFHQPNYGYDRYSGTCFHVDQTKHNIGLIFLPPQIFGQTSRILHGSYPTNIFPGHPIPNPTKIPANSQGNSLKCTNLRSSLPPSRPLLRVSRNCPHGKL